VRRGIIGGWPVRSEFVEQAAVSDQTAVTIEEQRPAAPPPGPPVEPPPERELWPWLLVLLVLVLAGIAVVYFATRDDKSQPQATPPAAVRPTIVPARPTTTAVRTPAPSARVTVPRLVGLTAPVALTRLRQLRLTGNTQNVFSEKPANVVVAQTPGSSRKLAKGETVMLNISKGPEAVAVPDVVGQTAADALSTLQAQAIKPRIVRVPSVEPAGQVVAQNPKAGAKARPRIAVRLNVSDGKHVTPTGKGSTPTTTVIATTNQAPTTTAAPANANPLVRVPDLEGKKLLDARRLIRRVGLLIEIRRVPNAQPLGTVIAQAKKPGTQLKRGRHLLITVSKGPKPATSTTPSQSGSQPIAVPDVTGEDEITATQDLENAGLTVQVVDRDTADASQDGIVVEQAPTANQSAQPSSTVTIYVGRYTSG
jgi:eukaryotic-like serine/threonine-protein kinase